MDKQYLLQRKLQLRDEFDNLQNSLNVKRQEIAKGDAELDRISGRFNEIEDMLSLIAVEELKPEIPEGTPASNVLEVKERQNAK